ncbi:alpha/beta fold hydrolase [Lentzea flaviverrucosa]|uniref:TAP-like protein n=1 Tax=Lentzea flaviverrucosa TaxID=200379 RepID=A0A1H9SZ10_9PSEU|nr:alpha/beta fold hydrolase [Lentzea flaviverrucosa]RDI25564.1 TAP-like protein [Lentzea flaviverrucosa]SER89613.1 TAP-like protein [Lentzea flaviverrucosa]
MTPAATRAVRVALVSALALGTVITGLGSASAQPGATSAVRPAAWGPCAADVLAEIPAAERTKVSCAVQAVPVDHSRPRGDSTGVVMMKRPAGDPAKKIGSLFINPGGPGGAGLIYSAYGSSFFTPEILEKFDLIGFDPRGVGRSAPLRCFRTQEEAEAVNEGWYALPITKDEIASSIRQSKVYTDYCKINAGPLLNHMSTEAVARDLDVMREAVGDRQLTFVGFSYGTLLGATYANIFPHRSRALVLDGNVDPQLRLTNGAQYDRERARGFEIALDAMLKRCDSVGVERCAFAGDARKKFDNIRESLRKSPTTLPGGTQVTLTDVVGRTASNLYSPTTFKALTTWLQSIHAAQNPSAALTAQSVVDVPMLNNLGGKADVRVLPETPYTSDDSYYAVNCIDKPFSRSNRNWAQTADRWERESRTFGRYQAASDLLTCPTWPARNPDRWIGPWNRHTKNPIVVVGNYYDPATQYLFSQRMAKQLGNARLISVDAFGHCILGDSAGADAAVTRYLVDLTAPANGQVFQPNAQPF